MTGFQQPFTWHPYSERLQFFEDKYEFKKCLLTNSCTDALEMCAMLCNLKPGDEVIVPSYTFVSTALAFFREGVTVIFADSMDHNPNLDAEEIEPLITPNAKVIVPVHYAGVSCDMDTIIVVAEKHNLLVVEDAAQAVDSYYNGRPLGGIGHLGAFSFHETKNITAGGEGGLLVINDESFLCRSEILWEKGTNRAEFFRSAVNKYGWVDMGSSFLPSEINAAFLWAQLENLDDIQIKRKSLWNQYFVNLQSLESRGLICLPQVPDYAFNNGIIFYIVCRNLEERSGFIAYLKEREVVAPFHYLSPHKSDLYVKNYGGFVKEMPLCDIYADCLVRMPMYYELEFEQVDMICEYISEFFAGKE